MGKTWVRAAGVALLLCGVMILLALLAGDVIPARAITDYHIQEGIRYPVLIHDATRGMALRLAGKRCFREPPTASEWNATRHQYQPSYYPEKLQVSEASAAALNRLRC